MTASFRNFMSGLIDYAGLFPPASLDLKTAVSNYTTYKGVDTSWMLGRFIIAAAQLHSLDPHAGLCCSVVVSHAVPEEELEQIGTFSASKGRVAMVETRFPESDRSSDACTNHLLQLESRLSQVGLQDVQLFIEAESLAPAVRSIADFNTSRRGEKVIKNAGYKLRCGGRQKQAFPAPEKVAEVISICREHDIPIKFTAGMHQPLRNHSSLIGAMQHGFINVFSAALLCWGCNLSTDEIAACLGDKTARHFHFTEEAFSWQGKTISASEIQRLRRNRVISFGSCSFTEPVEGLHSLGFSDTIGA